MGARARPSVRAGRPPTVEALPEVAFRPSGAPGEGAEILDRMTDGFVAYDREWRFTCLNKVAEAYFGRDRHALLGRVVWEAFPHAVGAPIEQEFRRAAASPVALEFELIAPLRQRVLAFKAFPSTSGISFYFHDVTERRAAEAARREADARYRAIFENAMDGVLLTSPTGEIHSVNPAACRMLGLEEAEIRARGRACLTEASTGQLAKLLESRQRDGMVCGELELLRSDGTRLPVEVTSALFADAGFAARATVILRDITERKQAENRLQLLSELATDLGRSLDVEETFANIVGFIVSRWAGVAFIDLVEDDRLVRVAGAHRDPRVAERFRALERAIVADEAAGGALQVLRTGEPELVPHVTDDWLRRSIPAEQRALALFDRPSSALLLPMVNAGRTIGVLSLGRFDDRPPFVADDVPLAAAFANRAATALIHARVHAAALQARRLRDDVLGIVSHDLRAPLNVVMLNASLLARRAQAPEAAAIIKAVRRADALVQDLLSAARAEGGSLPLDLDRWDASTLVVEAVERCAQEAEEARVALVAHVEPGLPALLLDRHRILQVLGNLIGNALKHTPAGGHIELRARREGERVHLEVEDSGCGIAPEAIPRLFDRFWQASVAHRAGAGLGLAIVLGIVKEHGGEISVRSELGRGSVFDLALPVAAHLPAPPPSFPPPSAPPPR